MNQLLISCKKATELVEKQKVTSLTFIEKGQLKMHLSLCKACHSYSLQSSIIDSFIANRKSANSTIVKNKLSKKAKAGILKSLGY